MPGWVAGAPIGALVIGGGTALNAQSSDHRPRAPTPAAICGRCGICLPTTITSAIFRGIHQFEAGFWVQRIQANDLLAQNQYGQASFGSLTSFLQGTIATFTVVPSPTPLGWRSQEVAGFVQDLIKVRKNLAIRIGFRFESTNGWNEVAGRAANYGFDANGVIQTNPTIGKSALAVNRAKFLPEPRVGLAWDPFGKGKTVVHTGFGIYRALLDNLDYRLDQTAPFNATESLKNIPVTGLQIVPGSPLPAGTKISPSGSQPDLFTPTVITWTFKMEQQIAASTSLGLGYVGSHGYHELLSVDANEPVPTICPAAPCPANLAAGTVYYPSGAPLANPNLANTTTWLSEGLGSYNALQVDVSRRFSQGFQIRGAYTWSKSLDDGTALNSSVGANAPGFVMYPANPKLDWSPANTDARHIVVINSTYELPFGAGKKFLRGVHGLPQKAGRRLDAQRRRNPSIGLPVYAAIGVQSDEQRRQPQPGTALLESRLHREAYSGRSQPVLRSECVHPAAPGTYGNTGRNVLVGPGLATTDLSFAKKHGDFREVESAIPRGIFQYFQPRQFWHTERRGVYLGDRRTLADGGCDHVHLHHLAADPVRVEAVVVTRAAGFPPRLRYS